MPLFSPNSPSSGNNNTTVQIEIHPLLKGTLKENGRKLSTSARKKDHPWGPKKSASYGPGSTFIMEGGVISIRKIKNCDSFQGPISVTE